MMNLSRRAFLLTSGALPFAWPDFLHANAMITIVIDHALSAYLPDKLQTNTRFIPLNGDAYWLWHEHVSQALVSSRVITGFTRPADAFVLTHLAESSGVRTIRHTHSADTVHWALFR